MTIDVLKYLEYKILKIPQTTIKEKLKLTSKDCKRLQRILSSTVGNKFYQRIYEDKINNILNDKNIENREEKFDFYKKILLYLEKIKQI